MNHSIQLNKNRLAVQEARSRGASLAIENEQLKKDRANARRMMEKRMAAAKFRGAKKMSKRGGGAAAGGGGGGGRKKVFNEQSRRASFIPENVSELVSDVTSAASQAKNEVNAGIKALRARAKKIKKGGNGEKYSKLG